MPLTFDERKLLAAGVHDATIEEVEQHFARFQRTDRRMNLFKKLTEYVAALRKAGVGESLIIDGSFIMPIVDQPEDIDMVLVMPEEWDMRAELRLYQYNLVSKKRIKQEFRFDVFAVKKGSSDEQRWMNFFSGINPKWREAFGWSDDAIRGLVRILL